MRFLDLEVRSRSHIKVTDVEVSAFSECFLSFFFLNRIQNLSLRYCSITSKGAYGIGLALGNMKKVVHPESSNTKLLSLNLSGNLIDDEGAEYIAKVSKYDQCNIEPGDKRGLLIL